jgi:L-ribulose-5-phosphate 3-epimerase
VKKGICYGCIDEGETFEAKLDATRQAGYEGVELSFDGQAPAPLRLDMDRPAVEALRATVERHGLEARSVMSGAALRETPILHADPAVRRRAVTNLGAALDRAAWLGATTMLVHPGQLRPETRYDEAWGWTVQVLRDLIPACERTGVGVGLENVWNKFLLAPTEMKQILDEVQHPLIGCYLDTANMLLYGYAEQWVPIVGRHIRKVHVKDFKRERGGGRFCQLLAGDCNYPAVMRELHALGYDDYLTSEVSRGERGEGQTMADTAARIDEIVAMA